MPDPVQAGVESVQLSGSDRPGGGEADQGERLAAGVSLDILKGDVLTEIVDPLTRSTQEDGQHQAADLVQLSRRAPNEDRLRATRHWERLAQSGRPAAQETGGERVWLAWVSLWPMSAWYSWVETTEGIWPTSSRVPNGGSASGQPPVCRMASSSSAAIRTGRPASTRLFSHLSMATS